MKNVNMEKNKNSGRLQLLQIAIFASYFKGSEDDDEWVLRGALQQI
jgi:hypothetical protein